MNLIDFIVCDDIRQEIGNKQTLVGVYGNSIEFTTTGSDVGKWPKGMRIGFYIRIRLDRGESQPDSFKLIRTFNDEEVELGAGNISGPEATEATTLSISLVHPNVGFPGEGEFAFKLSFFKQGEIIFDIAPVATLRIKEISTPGQEAK